MRVKKVFAVVSHGKQQHQFAATHPKPVERRFNGDGPQLFNVD